MQYSSARRTNFGSTAAASTSSALAGVGSRLSVPTRRTSTRSTFSSSSPSTGAAYGSSVSRYSSYSTPSPNRYSSRFSSTAPIETSASKFRTSRYDSYYNPGVRSSDLSESRYTSPATSSVSSRLYVTGNSRESSLSKSWPTPARNLNAGIDSSFRSSSSTVANSTSALIGRNQIGVGGSVPTLSSTNYLSADSRRGSSRSIDLALTQTPSASAIARKYLASGTDGNFDAGRAESLYRPSSRLNRYSSTKYDSTAVGGSRRSSVISTSSLSRSPVRIDSPSPGPANKSLWNRHYSSLSARWAEQSGATLNSTKNQYSYRPNATSSRRKMSTGTISDCSVEIKEKTRKRGKKKKEDSDGYDSSSSSDEEKTNLTKTKIPRLKNSFKRKLASDTATGSGNRRPRVGASASNYGNSCSTAGKEEKHSSSENETPQDSLDARIRARRKRLQKSKAMLQEHKEEAWNYRRTLQIEQSKQRQQSAAAATISYSRHTTEPRIKPEKELAKSDAQNGEHDGVKDAEPTETIFVERSPSKIGTVNSLDDKEAAAGQEATFQSLNIASDNGSTVRSDQEQRKMESSPRLRVQDENHRPSSISISPANTPVNVASKKRDDGKIVETVIYRRSPMLRASPTSNRSISNERTPPPPISQRQDFNYNEYVNSIAPKPVNYENPSAALIEADQQQQKEELPKTRKSNKHLLEKAVKENAKLETQPAKEKRMGEHSASKINNAPGDQRTEVKTKPLRTQPPTVVVVTAVTPPSVKRQINNAPPPTPKAPPDSSLSNSLNSIPTPFRRTTPSPIRVATNQTETFSTRSLERPSQRSSIQNQMNGATATRPTPDRSIQAITVVPMAMIPAKCVPEKITPTLTPTFIRPAPTRIQKSPNPDRGIADNVEKIVIKQEKPSTKTERDVSSRERTPSRANNDHSTALAIVRAAEDMLNATLKKHQVNESLRKESLVDLHRLPSVDREMLDLLTLGEELNNSRTSLVGQTPPTKFVQSFRVATQKSNHDTPLPPTPRVRQSLQKRSIETSPGSQESLNSYLNSIPKPWRGSREGSSESLASSFATAPSASNRMINSDQNNHFLNVHTKPWYGKLNGRERLSSSAEPLATLTEAPNESSYQKNTNSLELATKKVDEMLRLAKLRHKQQQRREKIILLQSIQNAKSGDPILDASKELDKAYEAIKMDYAEAIESRQRHKRDRLSDNESLFMKPQLVTVSSTVHMPKSITSDQQIDRKIHHERLRDDKWIKQKVPREKWSTQKIETHEKGPQKRASNEKWLSGKIDTNETWPSQKTHQTKSQNPYDKNKLDYTQRWLEGDLKSLARNTKPDLLQFGSAPRIDFDQRSVGSASAEVAAITNKDRLRSMRAVPDLVPQTQQAQPKPHLVKPVPFKSNQFSSLRVGQSASKSSSFAGGLASLQNQRTQQSQAAQQVNYNSGAIRQAVEQLRASAESLSHSEKSWAMPKTLTTRGNVKQRVDMFDRMSDNDSELSFRSADNVAYRSALYKPSRRLSLTDHMANFTRRFESDEENRSHGAQNSYRRPSNDLHSDDEARRLAVLRNPTFAPTFKRNEQNSIARGAGSTQSLPVTIPYQRTNVGAPTIVLQNAPPYQQKPSNAAPVQGKLATPIWLRNRPPATNQYWSSNSTLTDMEAPRVSNRHSAKFANSNDTMQAVDSLVAELELNTDTSGSVISQRSTSNFPVDKFYYQPSLPLDVDASSSRSKLNAIPEQIEQSTHSDARRDLKRGVHKWQMPVETSRGHDSLMVNSRSLQRHDQEKPRMYPPPLSQPLYASLNSQRSIESQSAQVQFRPSKIVNGRPASYAAPVALATPNHPTTNRGSVDRLGDRKFSFNNKEEGNYDNLVIGPWRSSERSLPPEPPRTAVPNSHLQSPTMIKIGNIVLGRGANDQKGQGIKNPLKNLFQLFNKSSNNGEISTRNQSTYNYGSPSTLSLNGDGDKSVANDHFHKSQSTSDAYMVKKKMTDQEMRQLDELLTSFHEDTANENQRKFVDSRTKVGVNSTKQESQKQIKSSSSDKTNHAQTQRNQSKFRLGLPSFWKRA